MARHLIVEHEKVQVKSKFFLSEEQYKMRRETILKPGLVKEKWTGKDPDDDFARGQNVGRHIAARRRPIRQAVTTQTLLEPPPTRAREVQVDGRGFRRAPGAQRKRAEEPVEQHGRLQGSPTCARRRGPAEWHRSRSQRRPHRRAMRWSP